MLKTIQEKNRNLMIYDIKNPIFSRYGQFHKVVDLKQFEPQLAQTHQTTPLEQLTVDLGADHDVLSYHYFGGQSIQGTLYSGHKQQLDTLEYHNSCELLIAVEDFVLAVGHRSELSQDYTYDTKHLKGFYVQKGQMIELYPSSLHSEPFELATEGVKVISVTPKKTGRRLKSNQSKGLLTYNTWTLAHQDAQQSDELYVGLQGRNYSVNY